MVSFSRCALAFVGLISGILAAGNDGRVCDFYLAPSTLPGAGRGVIAGNSWSVGEIVEITMSIAFKNDIVRHCQLNNYVFGYDHEYSMIIFGGGVLYNHMSELTVKHHWYDKDDDLVHPSKVHFPFSSSGSIQFLATIPIEPGQEIYSNYGENWFVERGLAEQDVHDGAGNKAVKQKAEATLVSVEELEQYGHCLTHVRIAESQIPFAGKGLFAKKPYKKGELVVIAPVLALAKELVYQTLESSVLANFVLTAPNSEVTLFPVNNAVAMNHQPSDTANVNIHWYDWSSIPKEGSYYEHIQGNTLSLEEKLAMTPEQLFAAPFSQLDIAFRATRDIEEGEELTYDYGVGWAIEWNAYVEELKAWEANQLAGGAEVTVDENGQTQGLDMSTIPQFRSYIGVPDGLFPPHWIHQ